MLYSRSSQLGMGLIEVMFALLLASLVMISLIKLYVTLLDDYQQSIACTNAQIQINQVKEIITALHNRSSHLNCLSHSAQELTVDEKSITFHTIDYLNAPISQITEQQIILKDSPRFNANTPFIISDCAHVETFEIAQRYTLGKESYLDLKQPLKYSYRLETEVAIPHTLRLFVAKSRFATRGYALFLKQDESLPDELVEGVEEIKIHCLYATEQAWQHCDNANNDLLALDIAYKLTINNDKKWFYLFLPITQNS